MPVGQDEFVNRSRHFVYDLIVTTRVSIITTVITIFAITAQ